MGQNKIRSIERALKKGILKERNGTLLRKVGKNKWVFFMKVESKDVEIIREDEQTNENSK